MTLSKQDIKKIKSSKIRDIFISIAEEMIINDSAANVSTRKIVQKSGYSLGTLYNYFQNIDELMWAVRLKIINDINSRTIDKLVKIKTTDDLSRVCIEIVKYIIKYPNIYNFIYHYELNPDCKPTDEKIHHVNVEDYIVYCGNKKNIDKEKMKTICYTVNFCICGMLCIYFSNNYDIDEEFIYNQIPKIIDNIAN